MKKYIYISLIVITAVVSGLCSRWVVCHGCTNTPIILLGIGSIVMCLLFIGAYTHAKEQEPTTKYKYYDWFN